ncbi:hypothetical protein B0H13DRAFT_1882961 [Mycena leptocephala]|nr:hypothetical protein B0H13DRAFT_1882961 [Mycena leptocephala]
MPISDENSESDIGTNFTVSSDGYEVPESTLELEDWGKQTIPHKRVCYFRPTFVVREHFRHEYLPAVPQFRNTCLQLFRTGYHSTGALQMNELPPFMPPPTLKVGFDPEIEPLHHMSINNTNVDIGWATQPTTNGINMGQTIWHIVSHDDGLTAGKTTGRNPNRGSNLSGCDDLDPPEPKQRSQLPRLLFQARRQTGIEPEQNSTYCIGTEALYSQLGRQAESWLPLPRRKIGRSGEHVGHDPILEVDGSSKHGIRQALNQNRNRHTALDQAQRLEGTLPAFHMPSSTPRGGMYEKRKRKRSNRDAGRWPRGPTHIYNVTSRYELASERRSADRLDAFRGRTSEADLACWRRLPSDWRRQATPINSDPLRIKLR